MSLLRKGRLLESNVTGSHYVVMTTCLDRGGFGEIYQGAEFDSRGRERRQVAIKASVDPLTWHGESYFGRLLGDLRDVVEQVDSFPIVDHGSRSRGVKYIIVLEWMDDGTVHDAVYGHRRHLPETEARTTKQIGELLEVLDALHSRGICHGDITPKNVFFRGAHLALGDLGIAKQALFSEPLELEGITPPMYAPLDTVPGLWTPSEDVYQVGLLALTLVSGVEVWSDELCGQVLKELKASDRLKGWIRDATMEKPQRFRDAGEALDALRSPLPKPARPPRSLRDQTLVFTGRMSMKRADARRKAEHAWSLVPRSDRQFHDSPGHRRASRAADRSFDKALRRLPTHATGAEDLLHHRGPVSAIAQEALRSVGLIERSSLRFQTGRPKASIHALSRWPDS